MSVKSYVDRDQLADRVQREKEIYNHGLDRARYDSALSHAAHLYREKRIRTAGNILRRKDGGKFLEIGCRTWPDFLGHQGVRPSELYCINISEAELDTGRARLHETSLRPIFKVMDAHNLEFEDGYFDAVFGTGILHHLDLDRSLNEIRRVLKPDGLMVFGEPLDNNPVGRLVRRLSPHLRTPDEQALRHQELARIQESFDCTFHFEEMLSVPFGVLSRFLFKEPDNRLTRAAFKADEALLARFPRLGFYFRSVLIEGHPK